MNVQQQTRKDAAKDRDGKNLSSSTNRFVWCDWVVSMLGTWMIASALSFNSVKPALFWNDIVCGTMLFLLGLSAVYTTRVWPRWSVAVIGAWLLLAPLLLWAPSGHTFEFDILCGCLAIALSFIIPGVPGHKTDNLEGTEIPQGWSYNPSAWNQRLPLIWMGLIGFFTARYLASYQLGYIPSVWDPFFAEGTVKVLTSDVSKAFPVSDAGLGAISYLIDALAGGIGSSRRWRTMPWMVLLFGALIVPAGVTSICLVMLQPIAVGYWCAICLFTAALMLFMVPLAVDEVIASCEFLLNGVRNGKSFWKLLFLGGEVENKSSSETKSKDETTGGCTGISVPWNLALATAFAVSIMSYPALLKCTESLATLEYIVGALAVTFSVCAMAEPCRAVRLLNVPAAMVLTATPFFFSSEANAQVLVANLICGSLLILMSLPKGKIVHSYGSLWNRFIV